MGDIIAYFGKGRGKTSAALGSAIHEAGQKKSVIIIQFLKQRNDAEASFIKRLEPEIRMFRFQKSSCFYDELTQEEQTEEQRNMRNGFNYARKVLQIEECDVLILDEILGAVDFGIFTEEEVISLLRLASFDTRIILTGRKLPEKLVPYVDTIYEISAAKE